MPNHVVLVVGGTCVLNSLFFSLITPGFRSEALKMGLSLLETGTETCGLRE